MNPTLTSLILSTTCCMFGFAFIDLCVPKGNGPNLFTDCEDSVYYSGTKASQCGWDVWFHFESMEATVPWQLIGLKHCLDCRYVGDDLRFADFQRAGTLGEVRIWPPRKPNLTSHMCIMCPPGAVRLNTLQLKQGLEKVPTWSNSKYDETRWKKQGKLESQHWILWHSIGADKICDGTSWKPT